MRKHFMMGSDDHDPFELPPFFLDLRENATERTAAWLRAQRTAP